VPVIETPVTPAPPKKTRAAKSTTTVPVEAPAALVTPKIELAPVQPVASPVAVVPALPKVATVTAPKKGKRARVPANLAEQYGQNLSKRVENGVEAASDEDESPKKRLSRAERAARRELRTEKRPRGWRFDCGRCGQTSYFQTSGALCNCGALALKE
jgi:hypothetical protein